MVADVRDYHKVTRRRDESHHAPACSAFHLFTSLFLFSAWPLRKSQDAIKKPANKAVLNSNGAKNSQDVREGRRRLPSRAPLNPSHCFLSIKALRDGFNVDGK